MFPACDDSDHSLSEEEYLSDDSPGRCAISLSSPFENKGSEMQVLSELEKLRKYAYRLDHGTNTTISNESQTAAEDEIEIPAFNNEDYNINHRTTASILDTDEENIHDQILANASVCNSDEEILSDDEKTNFTIIGSVKRNGERNTLFEASQSTSLSSEEQIFIKDGRSKAKTKFLFHFHSQNEDFPLVVSDKIETNMLRTDLQQTKESEYGRNVDIQKSMAESLEIINGREVEQLCKNAVLTASVMSRDCDGCSVADFLDSLQENCVQLRESSIQRNRLRGRRAQVAFRRSIAPLSSKNNDEDSLMDSRSSADDEGDLFEAKPVLQQKSMADLFHEALGSLSPNDVLSEVKTPTLDTGLFDKLQHVMLSEKEKDADFLEKPIIDDCCKNGKGCIDVRILSRSLEAKHNVCRCDIIRYEGRSQLVNDLDMTKQIRERTLTIIFSSRICGDVELEVGNEIRMQPPWKEVRVKGQDGVILLSTYFSRLGFLVPSFYY